MLCKYCGRENPDSALYCSSCGKKLKEIKKAKEEKSMLLALLLSFFLISMGLVYAGDKKKGIVLFVIGFFFSVLRKYPICFAISMLIWAYSLYETYREVKRANGEGDPNIIEDIKHLSDSENFPLAAVVAILLIFIACSIIGSHILLGY